jgi:general secretion pathway protein M
MTTTAASADATVRPTPPPASFVARRQQLAARWTALAPRERAWIMAAGFALGAFLLWSLAIGPAWRTTQAAPAQIDRLGLQLQTMQRLAAEAAELRNSAPVSPVQAGAALQSATERLGSRAQMVLQGDRATVTVKGLSGDDLRNWLAEVRSTARGRPLQVQLARDAQGYSGSVVLDLGSAR